MAQVLSYLLNAINLYYPFIIPIACVAVLLLLWWVATTLKPKSPLREEDVLLSVPRPVREPSRQPEPYQQAKIFYYLHKDLLKPFNILKEAFFQAISSSKNFQELTQEVFKFEKELILVNQRDAKRRGQDQLTSSNPDNFLKTFFNLKDSLIDEQLLLTEYKSNLRSILKLLDNVNNYYVQMRHDEISQILQNFINDAGIFNDDEIFKEFLYPCMCFIILGRDKSIRLIEQMEAKNVKDVLNELTQQVESSISLKP